MNLVAWPQAARALCSIWSLGVRRGRLACRGLLLRKNSVLQSGALTQADIMCKVRDSVRESREAASSARCSTCDQSPAVGRGRRARAELGGEHEGALALLRRG